MVDSRTNGHLTDPLPEEETPASEPIPLIARVLMGAFLLAFVLFFVIITLAGFFAS